MLGGSAHVPSRSSLKAPNGDAEQRTWVRPLERLHPSRRHMARGLGCAVIGGMHFDRSIDRSAPVPQSTSIDQPRIEAVDGRSAWAMMPIDRPQHHITRTHTRRPRGASIEAQNHTALSTLACPIESVLNGWLIPLLLLLHTNSRRLIDRTARTTEAGGLLASSATARAREVGSRCLCVNAGMQGRAGLHRLLQSSIH